MRGARQRAETSGSGDVVVQIVGDGNSVVLGHAHLALTRYLKRRKPRVVGEPAGDAAALLSPYAFSVPLVGRAPVVAELWRWLRSDVPISVRVMVAKGGAGKTRLALELCDQAVAAWWDAGFLPEGELARFRAVQNASTWGWRRPTLVVVDYAASRARHLREWLVELSNNPGRNGKPLRLLLLERSADPGGGWWREAFGVGGGDTEAILELLDPPVGPDVLPALVEPKERREVLESILIRVGSPLRPPAASRNDDFDRRLAEISWGGEPLFLLMAGLVAAQSGFAGALALSATDLGLRIASHEIHRFHEIAKSREIPPEFLAHLAAYATLCQGLSRDEAAAVAEEEERALGFRVARGPVGAAAALADALPAEQGNVAALLPDAVGEAVVVSALGNGSHDKALAAVFRATDRAGKKVTASLIRLSQDYGSVRPEALDWLEGVANGGKADLESLESLLDQLPANSLILGELAARLTGRGVVVAREQGRMDQLAKHLNNLSNRLGDLGSREEALTAIEEATVLHRELSVSHTDAFRPLLALSLNNLSNRLSDLGRWEEGLAAIEEAVAIRRELAASRPEIFRPDLAMSLNNLSVQLSNLERRIEALAAIEEATAIRRELAAARSDAFGPDLALSLNNLSVQLSNLGRRVEALAAIEEAVAIRRKLATTRPDAFRPDLATSLNNLSSQLSKLGRREEALAACEEAVRTLGPYFLAHPAAFRDRMGTMVRVYRKRVEESGAEPDRKLLGPLEVELREI